ncbi:type VII secretion protein EccB [Streptomyces sp. NPDC008092]|uniref:type VII secretion protein EccB n=1 Tax=Streptomyces sp. NPDC008092 TaxID=3364808 RepID=UPI0036DFEB4E
MQTRRDHVQAYQFAMGRLASALVSGDPGRGDSPTRRSALGSVFGVGVTVLLCAGFGVYGLISPVAKDDWRKDGAIVLEEDTGNRYVYAGGELRPVRNYASALLIAGGRGTPETVSAKSLAGVPHGTPVGIQGAPDTVPTASALATGAWARCLAGEGAGGSQSGSLPGTQSGGEEPDGKGPTGKEAGAKGTGAEGTGAEGAGAEGAGAEDAGAKDPADQGQALVFGSSAAALAALPADRQVLLTGPGDTRYLLLRGVKYPVPGDSTLIALGLDDQTALPATADWLAAVPTGAALAAPVPADAGKAAGQVAGQTAKVGQVFRTGTDGTGSNDSTGNTGNTGSAVHYYVMRSDGVARVNATEYALLAARPGAPAPRQVGPSDIAVAPLSADDATTGRIPDLTGVRALTGGTVCLTEAADGRARITVGAPGAGGVVLPAGGGVLAVPAGSSAGSSASSSASSSAGSSAGGDRAEYLITEQGLKYRIADTDAEKALGFGDGKRRLALPAGVLALVPDGPALSRAAAAKG